MNQAVFYRQTSFRFVIIAVLWLLITIPVWAAVSASTAPRITTPEQVFALYGQKVEFDVYRSGRSIGSHRLEFSEEQGMLRVDVEMDLHIRVLAVFNYRYNYQAIEWWKDGVLQQLEVQVNDDGDLTRLSAFLEGDQLRLVEGDETRWLPNDLITTNHWNIAILSQEAVLNTLTGESSRLSVEFLGDTKAPAGGEEVAVRLYRLGGELEDTQTWYDENGRWLGMEFSARDDSRIRLINLTIGG
ncbi:DUF6134 family protein [Nitrincola schmidtii]|uniref:DUF6134 family protein n=1 Tax=Nitrincola schmidtii TaxID=1730894 RepID=UPI00124E8F4F|nr:DUF6134 family protein [Nitrincola schmidtii]